MAYSELQLREWLNQKSRLFGWDMILAFDQHTLDDALLQDYIDRFDSGDYLPPLAGQFRQTDSQYNFLSNYQMDAPLLSFEEANLDDAWASLNMNVLSGSMATVSYASGLPRVMKLIVNDALDYQVLSARVQLSAPVEVSDTGTVHFDLKDANTFVLHFPAGSSDQQLGGTWFKQAFAKLPAQVRVRELIRFIQRPELALAIDSVVVRTQPSGPSARDRTSAEFGEGAVVAFINMKGGELGRVPTSGGDFRYLIPNDVSTRYTSSLLLSKRRAALSMMIVGSWRTFQAFITSMYVQGETLHARAGGVMHLPAATVQGANKMVLTFAKVEHSLALTFMITPVGTAGASEVLNIKFKLKTADGKTRDVTCKCVVLAAGDSQDVEPPRLVFSTGYQFGQWQGLEDLHPSVITAVEEATRDYLTKSVAGEHVIYPNDAITEATDLQVSLQASGFVPARYFQAHGRDLWEGDFGAFGHVNPQRTLFKVAPDRPVISNDGTSRFSVSPATSGVRWELHALPGYEGYPTGRIDPTTGVYQAPAGDQLHTSMTRVRITASKGADSNSTIATVMKRTISCNPIVQVCRYGETRQYTARLVGTGAIEARVAESTWGGRIVKNAHNDSEFIYTAGPRVEGTTFHVDTVVFRSAVSGAEQDCYVLVQHTDERVAIRLDWTHSASGPDRVKVEALVNGAPRAARFSVQKGSGYFDADTPEVYIVSPGTDGLPFGLIVAEIAGPGGLSLQGSLIISLPLVQYPTTAPTASSHY